MSSHIALKITTKEDASDIPRFTKNEYSHYSGSFSKKAKFKSLEDEFNWAKTQFKMCSKCHENLSLSNFNGNTSGSDPFDKSGYRLRRPECSTCTKKVSSGTTEAKTLARKMGIPYKAPPGTKCEICNSTTNIVFDHDHDTCTFRGRLCNSCNKSMGMLGDNPQGILKAFNYLNKNRKIKLHENDDGDYIIDQLSECEISP